MSLLAGVALGAETISLSVRPAVFSCTIRSLMATLQALQIRGGVHNLSVLITWEFLSWVPWHRPAIAACTLGYTARPNVNK